MDKKAKLNAKMNIAMFWTGFWCWAAKVFSKMNEFVLNCTIKAQSKEFDIIREMLEADYSEDYKNDLREVLKMSGDLA